MSSLKPVILVGLAGAFIAACIDTSADEGPVPPRLCEVDADCDRAAGEVCDQGICWGGPPAGVQFAALLVPPAERDDLVPTEIPLLSLGTAGEAAELGFAPTVVLSGRVVIAGAQAPSVAAQIRINRASAIKGGPAYTRTLVAQPGLGPGEIAFAVSLPRLADGEPGYDVRVLPDDGTLADPLGERAPADLAPPLKLGFAGVSDLQGVELVLGEPQQLKRVDGQVVDAAARGMAGMRVTALGRFTAEGPLERASSRATTDDGGWFTLWVPRDVVDDRYELVVRPPTGVVAPTLRQHNLELPDPDGDEPLDLGVVVMPSFPASARYTLPVRAAAPAGGLGPVEGAEVRVSTTLLTGDGVASGGLTAEYSTSGVTDASGSVSLELIPGGTRLREYQVSVQPLASSSAAAIYGAPLAVGLPGVDGGVLSPVSLGFRVPVTGRVVSHAGVPVAGAAIAAAPYLAYRWGLDLERQAVLDDLHFPTATTDDNGRFAFWLDRTLLGQAAAYDIQIVPPPASLAPRWSVRGITLSAERGNEVGVDLGPLELPEAAFARARAVDAQGVPVSSAELKVYEIASDTSVCEGATLPDPDAECYPPPLLRQVTQTDPQGRAVLVLPDPH
jgi:hypothetical protein